MKYWKFNITKTSDPKPSLFVRIINAIYIVLGLIPLFIIIFIILFSFLYCIKTLLGIDIFPGGHFWEFL